MFAMCLKKDRKAHKRSGKYRCKNCGAASDKKKRLCKPKKT